MCSCAVNRFFWAAEMMKALYIAGEVASITTTSCNTWDSPGVFFFAINLGMALCFTYVFLQHVLTFSSRKLLFPRAECSGPLSNALSISWCLQALRAVAVEHMACCKIKLHKLG